VRLRKPSQGRRPCPRLCNPFTRLLAPPVITSFLLVAYLAGICLGLSILQLTSSHDRQDDPNP
jgi:hypothetical protein